MNQQVAEAPQTSSEPSFLERAQSSQKTDQLAAIQVYRQTVLAEARNQPTPIEPGQLTSLLNAIGKTETDFAEAVRRAKAIVADTANSLKVEQLRDEQAAAETQLDSVAAELERVSEPFESKIEGLNHDIACHRQAIQMASRKTAGTADSIPNEYCDFIDGPDDAHTASVKLRQRLGKISRPLMEAEDRLSRLEAGEIVERTSLEDVGPRGQIEQAREVAKDLSSQRDRIQPKLDAISERSALLASWICRDTGIFVPELSPDELPKIRV